MRLLSFAIIAAFAHVTPSRAQKIATVVVYVTVQPSSTSSSPSVGGTSQAADTERQGQPTLSTSSTLAFTAIIPQAVSSDDQQQDSRPTLLPSSSDFTSSTSLSTPSPTSKLIHEATSSQYLPEVAVAASTASTYYEPGPSSPGGGGIDTEGGASGSDAAAFRLSKGGLAAILIVVILVSLFGIASIVLFIVAKRRQWTMRQTLTRASRRLTGRSNHPKTPQTATAANRRSRRTGIRMGSPSRPGVKAVYPPGHKRGLVVDVKDPEKGPQPLDGKAPKNTRPRENTWVQRLWGDGWK